MSEKIDDKIMEYIGILSQLELTGKERENVKADMEKMLNYIKILNQLDTEKTEPMIHCFSYPNVFREDERKNKDRRDDMLSNAPAQKEGQYLVPKTVE